MKNKKKIIIIVAIMLFILMLIPIKDKLWDGGSTVYKAILYKVTKIHKINHESATGYEDGWKVDVLGIPVYNEVDVYAVAGQDRKDTIACLENELGGYLVTEQDELVEIPLSEIKGVDKDKIEYFKGVYASNHKDNTYLIIYPKNGTYEAHVMNKFTEYFSNKFSTYQIFDAPNIPTIYIHTKDNNIDLKDLTNKCITKPVENKSKKIDTTIIKKLNTTDKIVIKSGNKILGEINDKNKIDTVIDAINSSRQYGDAFLCDSPAFDFVMFNNKKRINTIHVYYDGIRLFPDDEKEGCAYYSISDDTDLRKIIESETDYIFYTILNYSDTFTDALELIYKNNGHKYYLKTINSDKIMIKFMTQNKIMTIKSALENNLISADRVVSDYPDLLIKK